MTPAIKDLADVVSGDTWDGLSDGAVAIDGDAPESALARVRMTFTRVLAGRGEGPSLVLDSQSGTATIEDAATWAWSIPAVAQFNLPFGKYDYSLEFTDASGVEKSYVQGQIQVLRK